jgi:hypothetical protein
MSGPWYNADLYGWIPGTAFGCLLGLWGGVVGVLASRGRGRRFVFASHTLLLAASAGLFVLALAGLVTGQPYGVWYGLGLPGLLGLVLLGAALVPMRLRYREAERRAMEARDLS